MTSVDGLLSKGVLGPRNYFRDEVMPARTVELISTIPKSPTIEINQPRNLRQIERNVIILLEVSGQCRRTKVGKGEYSAVSTGDVYI